MNVESFALSVAEEVSADNQDSEEFQFDWTIIVDIVMRFIENCRDRQLKRWHQLGNSSNNRRAKTAKKRLSRAVNRRLSSKEQKYSDTLVDKFLAMSYDELVEGLEN